NWRSDQEAEIITTTIPPSDGFESAIVRTLAPAPYTALVRGVNNTSGVALARRSLHARLRPQGECFLGHGLRTALRAI
ncbi:MAG: hypothetical protein M3372_05980, partial [Verrucomicrobiota bacterium]|nr:hypothetical protein [Verrucomicrobiota bacterium]